jgi:hypothetical protein
MRLATSNDGRRESLVPDEICRKAGYSTIANSVVNLTVDTGLASTECTLYASYLYNCTFLASGGSGDYVF